jgi:hypothetical protein
MMKQNEMIFHLFYAISKCYNAALGIAAEILFPGIFVLMPGKRLKRKARPAGERHH